MGNYNDKEIITLIKSGNREKAIASLYQTYYPKVKKFVSSRNGSSDDAKDIFQEVILQLYLKITDSRLLEEGINIGGFIIQSAQNKWVDKIRKDKRLEFTEDVVNVSNTKSALDNNNLTALLNKERTLVIDKILSSIGDKCKELLRLSIFYNLSMKEIAEKLGFSSEDSAKTQHYKCKLKLIQLYKENPHIKYLLSHSAHE